MFNVLTYKILIFSSAGGIHVDITKAGCDPVHAMQMCGIVKWHYLLSVLPYVYNIGLSIPCSVFNVYVTQKKKLICFICGEIIIYVNMYITATYSMKRVTCSTSNVQA